MSGFLDEMARSSSERVAAAQRIEPYAALALRARALDAAPALKLSPQGFDVIAELKLRSPAQGRLGSRSDDWLQRIAHYAAGGAAAVSVLTEPSRFDGSLDDLNRAAAALGNCRAPAFAVNHGAAPPNHALAAARPVAVMRKDFLVDPYQILEARVNGASGVLVILRMLARERIEVLLDEAASLQMFVLLEAFDSADLKLAHALADSRRGVKETILVGINCRDLQTLQVVPSRFEELAAELPSAWPSVAESGVSTAADAARMARLGYRLALIGTALMSHDRPELLLADMLAASRHSAS
jgi:indole-3-glycerol phosphate synthase